MSRFDPKQTLPKLIDQTFLQRRPPSGGLPRSPDSDPFVEHSIRYPRAVQIAAGPRWNEHLLGRPTTDVLGHIRAPDTSEFSFVPPFVWL